MLKIICWIFSLVNLHGATTRQLVETVWPGLPAATITNRLYTTLYDLRTQLKDVLDRPLIHRRADLHTLDPAAVDVDLWHLHTAADAADAALTTPERHHAHTAVIRHYRGELAIGQPWPWLAGARETIRNRVVDAYADLTEQLPAADALPLLRDAITVDPYNEHLHHRTIAALTDLGDHAAANRLQAAYIARLTDTGLRPRTSTTAATRSS